MAISFCAKRIKILNSKYLNKVVVRRNGYIVLLPEIGEDLPEKDPLLKQDGFPEFNKFSIERAITAVGKETVAYEQDIQQIEQRIMMKDKVDIVNDVINPMEISNSRLQTTWSIAKTLYFGNQSLMPTHYYESIHNNMAKVYTMPYMSYSLYKAWKNAATDEEINSKLTVEQKRIVKKYALEGKLNGLDLDKNKTNRFMYTLTKISTKRADFDRAIRFATSVFRTTISDRNILKEFPEDFLKLTAVNPDDWEKGPWKITLQPHIVDLFLKYCPERDHRWNVWQAYVGRGAMRGDRRLRTSSILEDIRDNKIEQAKVLGYKSYSHLSMETKIAGSLNNIYRVMDNLLETAYPAQKQEFNELSQFAKDQGFNKELLAWDIDYWSRKYANTILNYNNETIKNYFPLPYVLNGLFKLIENLFSIRIIEGQKPDVWHKDVKFFEIIDLKGSTDEPIAHFYFDPYERGRKMASAETACWMVPIQNKSTLTSKKPLVALIFNFKPPVNDDIPSLLTFDDVKYLFKQMGQALQHLLTRVNYSMLAGTSNVEWDAVGISGNFMVNWLYEPETIENISCHYKTNETIPPEQVSSIKRMRRHMSGYRLCKELYYGRLDLELHELPDFWVPIVTRLHKKHFVYPLDKMDSHITSWSTIFTDNWGAAYYSHLWSEMLAADVYSAFQEITNADEEQKKQTAERFRDTFLSLGGSVHASQIFRLFRGRDPNYEALLYNVGLKDNKFNQSDV
ncbi:uncharacterized protein LOC130669879 [Microplitis mediator]|uniref:uncharacterized protein LOC130669879 n=1 Tax=Microplitis mediator TaxID=375433 RepID=UPI0025553B36|nr:uncharacterized protein LOC130669879 [Microplitis mediator]